MNPMRLARRRDWLYVAVLVTLVYLSYGTGFRGDWQFDDALNLSGLAGVSDFPSAMSFVLGGLSSELGRPVALASFLVNRSDWPCCPEGFRQVNTVIHLVNGLLVYLLARRVTALWPQSPERAIGLPLTLTGLWLAHPLLVSTSMSAVQRMTSLSASFVLLGLLGYLVGREHLKAARVRSGYVWLSASLAGGSLLGVLVKESAALLPLFAAVAELFLLRILRPLGPTPYWRAWRWLFFSLPAALLVAYAVLHWDGIATMGLRRPFDLSGRLASEAVILWEYLRQILVPDISTMGPYHDDAVVRTWSDPLVVLALGAWLILAILAWRLRKGWPLVPFALAWFAVGQLLESTVFPLELYFEHRNYLASLGPLALATALLWRLPVRLVRPVAAAIVVLFLLLSFQTARIWGEPNRAAAVWFTAHPGSVRASKDLGARLVASGRYQAALRVLETTREVHPLSGDLGLDLLKIHCVTGDYARADREFARLTGLASKLTVGNTMLATLHDVVRLNRAGRCGSFGQTDLLGFAAQLLANPHIDGNRRHRHILHIVMSDIARGRGDTDAAIGHLRAAFLAWPQVEVAQIYIYDLIAAGRVEEARGQIAEVRALAPAHPWLHRAWSMKLDELEALAKSK
ncbi:hypothetical protein EZJ19_09140 [Parasulfuritortus cantonensis]|uniref:Tetratricopeptide repeat protein n=1 Tax=Parasulfuritortus cantonensis TaxID=2528202 RepID=A0A4R1BCH4_9PROT|nr:hypothetical protein [Parasulfuritortus cantonensis]TCJ14736.1 hypothetical protein EZJ19_09140 [Parasulfuritortus cantonensis]